MKKTLMTCMAVLALLAIASGASAITCTIDQRPAATLLVPYFEVTYGADLTPLRTTDTLLTIGNASDANMIAHVNVFNERSVLVLDFNIALTGYDIQSMRLSDVLSGILPSTPIGTNHVGPDTSIDPEEDVCQRNDLRAVYPDPGGFIRVDPVNPATPDDNTLATAAYPVPAYAPNGPFAQQVIDSLDSTPDSLGCDDGTVDGVLEGPIRGYITIDHANYCNLSNPSDLAYYTNDAMGNENNLWGEIVFLNQEGIGTYGMSTVNIESDESFSGDLQSDGARLRTFYARYWSPSLELPCQNCAPGPDGDENDLDDPFRSPWNVASGDQREPLGLKYAARYFQGGGVSSTFDVWRGSSGALSDLTGTPAGDCSDVLPTVQLNFFDEDENGVSQIGPGPCPSPCQTPPPPTFNFPLETQRRAVSDFTLPPAVGGINVGWVSMGFNNTAVGPTNNFGSLDQAWVGYNFTGSAAFLSASVPGTQLDPSTCEPLGIFPIILPQIPAIPGGVDGSGVPIPPPAGVGP